MEIEDSITNGFAAMFSATFLVYSLLFGTGYFLYGNWTAFAASLIVGTVSAILLLKVWNTK